MKFDWDEVKSRRNLAKHKISFEVAQSIFEDPNLVSLLDRVVDGEERWNSLGLLEGAAVVLVVHTYCDRAGGEEVIRIISARKATPTERRNYETRHE